MQFNIMVYYYHNVVMFYLHTKTSLAESLFVLVPIHKYTSKFMVWPKLYFSAHKFSVLK